LIDTYGNRTASSFSGSFPFKEPGNEDDRTVLGNKQKIMKFVVSNDSTASSFLAGASHFKEPRKMDDRTVLRQTMEK
jgi:hypothetical protein